MVGLIEQIQRDALDPKISVIALLRRIKLAAAKLGIGDLASWVDHELNGYPNYNVPQYRIIYGRLMGWNPYNGWIPVIGSLPEEVNKFCAREAISSIEALLEREKGNGIHVNVDHDLVCILNDATGLPLGRYAIHISRGHVVNAVEAVRNLVLEFAIELERRGVSGKEFSFTNDEKLKAQAIPMSVVTGPIGTLIGNLGSGNTTGNITVGNIDVKAATTLSEQIKGYLPLLAEEGVDLTKVQPSLDRMAEEAKKSEPSQSVIRGALTDIRNALSGAGGSLLATGIAEGISKLLGAS